MWDRIQRLHEHHGEVPLEVRILKPTEEVGARRCVGLPCETHMENPAHEEPGGICNDYNAWAARRLPEDVTSQVGGGTGL